MKQVRAIADGFYGCRRRPGDIFSVKDNAKGTWFVPVEPPAEAQPEGKKPRGKASPDLA